jgi:hypothetical protein
MDSLLADSFFVKELRNPAKRDMLAVERIGKPLEEVTRSTHLGHDSTNHSRAGRATKRHALPLRAASKAKTLTRIVARAMQKLATLKRAIAPQGAGIIQPAMLRALSAACSGGSEESQSLATNRPPVRHPGRCALHLQERFFGPIKPALKNDSANGGSGAN